VKKTSLAVARRCSAPSVGPKKRGGGRKEGQIPFPVINSTSVSTLSCLFLCGLLADQGALFGDGREQGSGEWRILFDWRLAVIQRRASRVLAIHQFR
jgi:hypothetical protein